MSFSSGLQLCSAIPQHHETRRLVSLLRKRSFGVCRVWSQLYDNPRIAHIGPGRQSGCRVEFGSPLLLQASKTSVPGTAAQREACSKQP